MILIKTPQKYLKYQPSSPKTCLCKFHILVFALYPFNSVSRTRSLRVSNIPDSLKNASKNRSLILGGQVNKSRKSQPKIDRCSEWHCTLHCNDYSTIFLCPLNVGNICKDDQCRGPSIKDKGHRAG